MDVEELIGKYEAGERNFADLSGANLSGAILDGASFDSANLTNANLINASGAAFLSEGIFCNTTMPDASIRNDGCSEIQR